MTEPSRPPVRPALVANLLAQISLGLMLMTLCLPSMQEWGALFDAPQADVQLTFSAYVATYGLLQVLYGPLSDRRGRRPILIMGLVLALVGSVLGGLAPDLGTLVLARTIQGAGGAAGMVVGRSMIHDWFEGPQRTRMMAFVGMTMGVIPPTATIVGGSLHVHWGWQANFGVMVVITAVLLAAAWWGLPRVAVAAPAKPFRLGDWIAAHGTLMRTHRFLWSLLILACTTATFYTLLAGAPIVLKSYGVGPDGIGFFIMFGPIAYIVGNFMTTHLAHRVGERRVMNWGQTLSYGAVLLMAALPWLGWRSPLAFALPLVLLGLGHGLLVPPVLSTSISQVPALAGTAAGAVGLLQQWTGALGSYSVGWVEHPDATPLGLLMTVFATGALYAHFRLWYPRRHLG